MPAYKITFTPPEGGETIVDSAGGKNATEALIEFRAKHAISDDYGDGAFNVEDLPAPQD